MSKRAESAALKAYPERLEWSVYGPIPFDGNYTSREKYLEGYEQAEKDLGWVSVKDRLPEKCGFYFTCVNQAGVAQCVGLQYFDTNLTKWRDFDEEVREVFIDYWMEIPKLPKEDEK